MKKLATLALAIALAGAAAPAYADEFTHADRDYLADLAEQRGTLGDDPRQQVELGVATCGALRAWPVQTVVDTGIASGIDGYDTGILVAAASRNYCPDTWPRVIDWIEHV
ncbi:hypothetical protein TPB0596_12340 [Tsukamurella pulmonis]|uniref:DUF732 domain-containing protein n=1 Tax=Tsukamurella pulmonis TaxID=47312 RepID=UPI001EE1437B|nr:DUF732 domain-containing protein [Tsukamurella pulmonis]BDD81471.1 hypothetical protein TPB0596_12340 [Tsukamurella pulmonis]